MSRYHSSRFSAETNVMPGGSEVEICMFEIRVHGQARRRAYCCTLESSLVNRFVPRPDIV